MGPGEFRTLRPPFSGVPCGLAPGLRSWVHGLTGDILNWCLSQPFGCHGNQPNGLAQGPMAPYWGGGNTLSRGSAGEYGSISPLFPSILPRWPPCKGFSVGTSQESWENSILDIRVVLHGYFLHEYMRSILRLSANLLVILVNLEDS